MKVDPERVASLLACLQAIKRNPRQWAEELRKREIQCERLTNAQRDAWRHVIHGCGVPDGRGGTFNAIDPMCLPRGMRPDARTVVREEEFA